MTRKSSLLKQTLATILVLLVVYALLNTFLSPANSSSSSSFSSSSPKSMSKLETTFPFTYANSASIENGFSLENANNFPGESVLKVYLYELPKRFTHGVIMAEWYLYKDLIRPDSDRVGSPVIRVSDPEEADLFYVPFFSSLSLIVNTARPGGSSSGPDQARVMYCDEENQEALVDWLEEQEYWKRNNGRDRVIVAQDPNALYRVIDKIKNSVLLVSDFGRLRSDQASLIKDVIVPYSHRINSYTGDVGVGNRKTLLFFMGARYRKEGGKIRDLLFQLLENEEDVIVRHGTQSRENRRACFPRDA